jgi:predicted TIM-barrel fold metal-dependent hydrolase
MLMALLFSSVMASAQLLTGPKQVFDMHVHFACVEDKNDCYIHPAFREHWKYSIYMQALGVTKQEIASQGDGLIVQRLIQKFGLSQRLKKAVVLALDGVYDRKTGELDRVKTQVKFSNRFLYEKIKDHPSLLMGVSINPFSKNALQELEWAHKHGAAIVKWIPCIMDFSPDEKDERLTAFYKKLVEYNMPLLSHTGNEGTFLFSNDNYCNPEALRVPLKLGVTVVAAHLSSKGKFSVSDKLGDLTVQAATAGLTKEDKEDKKVKGVELVYQLMREFPNFYVDISAVTQVNRYNHLELVKPLLDTRRVLYGSDWPLISAQLMGLPLVSWRYYGFQLDEGTIKAIKASPSDFDKDVLLKVGLGIPETVFEDTAKFFTSAER